MIKTLDARIRRYLSGIRLAFRGVITLVKSAGAVQFVQLDGVSGEQLQNNELFQQFGYTSNPPVGSMCIVLPIGGKTAHGIIIATEHGTYRLKNLASGEMAIYNQWGDHVTLKADRRMQVVSSVAVDITTPTVNMSGNLNVTGNIIAQGDISDHNNKSMLGMRNTYNSHTHSDPQGGSVGTPTGQM
ncbi:MAG: phage baseplate assembly protein [Nitrosomonadales bacterium]|nr:phage baseplate assembly protein [Nitrosomonadales bacterium]